MGLAYNAWGARDARLIAQEATMVRPFLCFWLFFVGSLSADYLVLRNGKQLRILGAFEIQGQFVRFKTEAGTLVQLPLKAVDLEKSRALTETERAKPTQAQAPPAPKQGKKHLTMQEIAEIVQKGRDSPEEPPAPMQISDEALQKYQDSNPRPEYSQAEFVGPEADTMTDPQGFATKRSEFGEAYQSLKKELGALDANIAEMENFVESASQTSGTTDDMTGSHFRMMERYEQQLAELKQKRLAKQKEFDEVRRNARQAGLRGLNRYKPKKDKDDDQR